MQATESPRRINLAGDPPWLTLLYWVSFILAPETMSLGGVFGYWAATHAYAIEESSEGHPSSAEG